MHADARTSDGHGKTAIFRRRGIYYCGDDCSVRQPSILAAAKRASTGDE